MREGYDALGGDRGTGPGLTEEQRDAPAAAPEVDYLAVPHRVTLGELAERLGISDTAASRRIRRRLSTLLSATLGVELAEERRTERD
ncbi:MAG: helix-turn-helix domain-containing protein [Haloarculaceae archaeon]